MSVYAHGFLGLRNGDVADFSPDDGLRNLFS